MRTSRIRTENGDDWNATPQGAVGEEQGRPLARSMEFVMEVKHNQDNPYARLAIMALLSFIAMYALMYAMVDRFANVYPNLNQAYMAALMAAPMVAIEIVLMASMYPSKRTNALILTGSTLVLVAAFWAIREQGAIGDDEFLRSMIPHHAGAILMCQEASIRDAEIQELCGAIIEGQRQEIETMKQMLDRSG
jgi:hypothetical protein